MDDHDNVTLTPVARLALGRTLGQEEQLSNLIAFLTAIDAGPLAAALGLGSSGVTVTREFLLPHDGGRVDLLVRAAGVPAALIEVKASADQHGEQISHYDGWAQAQEPAVACFLVGITSDHDGLPEGWRTDLTLPALLRHWLDSPNPHAAWLAGAAAAVLDDWVSQLDGKIGEATHLVVADLLVRRLAKDLRNQATRLGQGLVVEPGRTHPGAACLLAWLPFPAEPPSRRAWLCLDLRAGQRSTPGKPWLLRLGVEVDVDPSAPRDLRSVARARVDAHDLAVPLRAAFTCSAVLESLTQADRDDLASAVAPARRSRDGLRANPSQDELDAWRATAMCAPSPGAHPALFHDWGRRLAGQLSVDVGRLDRHQLLDLVVLSLDHLQRAARTATATARTQP